jgi:hypothetical protein
VHRSKPARAGHPEAEITVCGCKKFFKGPTAPLEAGSSQDSPRATSAAWSASEIHGPCVNHTDRRRRWHLLPRRRPRDSCGGWPREAALGLAARRWQFPKRALSRLAARASAIRSSPGRSVVLRHAIPPGRCRWRRPRDARRGCTPLPQRSQGPAVRTAERAQSGQSWPAYRPCQMALAPGPSCPVTSTLSSAFNAQAIP